VSEGGQRFTTMEGTVSEVIEMIRVKEPRLAPPAAQKTILVLSFDISENGRRPTPLTNMTSKIWPREVKAWRLH
jgi:hypothetical protein